MHAGRWGGLAARGTKGSASAERLNAIPVCLTPELGARRSSTSGSGRRRFQIRNRNREQNRKWKQERNKNKEQLQNFIWDSFDLSKGIDTLTMPYLEKLVMNRWDFIYQHQDDHAVKRALENLNSDYKENKLSLAKQRAARQQRAAEQRPKSAGKKRMHPHNDFSEKFIEAFEGICKQRKIPFKNDDVSRALIPTIFETMRKST